MGNFFNTKSRIQSIEDLGRLFGSKVDFSAEAVARRVLRKTDFEVGMNIVYTDDVEISEEHWQIEVSHRAHKVKVRMRPAGRGDWISNPDKVPARLLEMVHADPRSKGKILSQRSWNAWQKARWANKSFRRHKSRSGVLNFSMDIEGVERKTGRQTCSVFVEPLLDDEVKAPVRSLTMPFSVSDLWAVVEDARLTCRPQLAAA